jgi:hypothetical protein
MRETAGDPAVLELLRMQRSRLADRLRPPWWYVPGAAIAWAEAFANPFVLRYLSRADYWAAGAVQLAVWCLLQWGLNRPPGSRWAPARCACCETASTTTAPAGPP